MKYKGLTDEEAKRLLEQYGRNIFVKLEKRTPLDILKNQFRNPIIYLLIVAALLSFYLGEIIEGWAIVVAVLLTILFGFYLEFKADESLEKLRSYQKIKVIVIRSGKEKVVDAEEIVPGDIIYVEAGGLIPADGVVLESHYFGVDESSLTGESEEVKKKKNDKVYAGTIVMHGFAYIRVEGTGRNTEFGKLAKSLEDIEEGKSFLAYASEELAKKISIFSLAVIVLFFLLGVTILGNSIGVEELFIFSITLAVAAVPEGLTTVFTIILALGVNEMAKNKALVRKLSSVEMLGKADVIATDKTGTITLGESRLKYYTNDETVLYGFLCSTAKEDKGVFVGEDIDIALYKHVVSREGDLREKYRYEKIEPFSPEKKYMRVIVKKGNKRFEIIKGALEALKKFSTVSREVVKEAERLYKQGFRVIGVVVNGKFVGLLGFIDPLKDGVRETIQSYYKAGIDVIVITGDNVLTATYIAKEAGIRGEAIEWKKLEKMEDWELYHALKKYKVIARALPSSKLRIVEVLQKNGHVVVVTGDGINDAPALKKADVGIVMGKKGSEISKQVSDIVLLDDNFSTLVRAIEYGRNTFFNILNFIRFQFTTNFAALMLVLLSFLLKFKLPLTPIQLLWINIIMDGPPALSQAFEKKRKEVLEGNPIKKIKGLLSGNMIKVVLLNAFFMALLCFSVFSAYLDKGEGYAITMTFNLFALMQLFNAFNARSLKYSAFREITANRILIISFIVMCALQLFININPFTAEVFSLEKLELVDYIKIVALSASIIIFEELRKIFGIWQTP